MRNKWKAAGLWALVALAVAALALAGSDAFWSSDQNGRLWSLKSGGEINIESGGVLRFAGTQFTPSDYATAVSLADYVLFAGDADGQTIQGRTGSDRARLDIGESDSAAVTILGAGASASYVQVSTGFAAISSPNDENALFASTTGIVLGVTSGSLNITTSQTPPTNANDSCTTGDFIPTTGFIYVCVAPDTWQRIAIATWP